MTNNGAAPKLAIDEVADLDRLGPHGGAKPQCSSSRSNVQRGKIVLATDATSMYKTAPGKIS